MVGKRKKLCSRTVLRRQDIILNFVLGLETYISHNFKATYSCSHTGFLLKHFYHVLPTSPPPLQSNWDLLSIISLSNCTTNVVTQFAVHRNASPCTDPRPLDSLPASFLLPSYPQQTLTITQACMTLQTTLGLLPKHLNNVFEQHPYFLKCLVKS